ncbi:MAG: alpha/beta hydrolase [Sideroxydans sp.]|nr:alpha/beta hydrolase [Sideroxydans sp.]
MKRRTSIIALISAGLISGCASLPQTAGERHVEYALVNRGTIPVVFENGLGARMENWKKVLPEISKDNTTFTYNRPGYGDSDGTTTPRDGEHVVDELRTLLRSKGLNPPYILVGHSLGGLYMQHFARRYPDEVAALVLVDSTHPEQMKGKGSPENWPTWIRFGFWVWGSSTVKSEFAGVNTTGETVLSLPTFSGKPVILLTATQPKDAKSELDINVQEKRADLLRLYPGAKQIMVDSGHNIQVEKPQAVIDAIREVLPLIPRKDDANLK